MLGNSAFADLLFTSPLEEVSGTWMAVHAPQAPRWTQVKEVESTVNLNSNWTPVKIQQSSNWVDVDTK
jgi:hypothetical protein